MLTSGQLDGEARQVEFVALWAAAKVAVLGDPILAFDQAALREAQLLPSDANPSELIWLYPPGLQLLLAPLGLLPYWAAWLSFSVISLAAFASAHWRLATAVPMGAALLVGAPIVIISFQLGHLPLLWAAGLTLAMLEMHRGRYWAAGLLLALLSLKPQLGVLIPFALLGAGYFSVCLWAVLWAVAVHGIPTLFVGIEYWGAFIQRMESAASSLGSGGLPWTMMVTPYSLLRLLSFSSEAAFILQLCCSLVLTAAVMLVWSRQYVDRNIAVGVLFAAIPLATPYAFFYELVIAVPAVIFLVRGGYGAGVIDRLLLSMAIFAPAAFWISISLAPYMCLILGAIFVRATHFGMKGGASR